MSFFFLITDTFYFDEITTLPSGGYIAFSEQNVACSSSQAFSPNWDCHVKGRQFCQDNGFDGMVDHRMDSDDMEFIVSTLCESNKQSSHLPKKKSNCLCLYFPFSSILLPDWSNTLKYQYFGLDGVMKYHSKKWRFEYCEPDCDSAFDSIDYKFLPNNAIRNFQWRVNWRMGRIRAYDNNESESCCPLENLL